MKNKYWTNVRQTNVLLSNYLGIETRYTKEIILFSMEFLSFLEYFSVSLADRDFERDLNEATRI